jgi:hypothetical protein
MSYTFLVTAVGLDPEISTVTTADGKEDLGHLEIDRILELVERLQKVDAAAARKVDAGILVRRGDKGWRINAHHGQLRIYHSTSSLDDYWTVANVKGLEELAPFRPAVAEKLASKGGRLGSTRPGGVWRTVGEIGGLALAAVGCMALAIYFGTPRRKLSAPPDDVRIVRNAAEAQDVFRRVAGTYATGRKAGSSVVVINSDGKVILSQLGKDGRPVTPPKVDEQARVGLRGATPVVVTSFGLITPNDAESVNVGAYPWRRAEPL